jgi:hypothetical protein
MLRYGMRGGGEREWELLTHYGRSVDESAFLAVSWARVSKGLV